MSDRVANLELIAARCRRNVVRMIETGHSGHLGGAMSAIDVLTALYFDIMRVDPARPDWPERDRFLLSAGHKAMGQYAVLAERGFFDTSLLDTYGAMRTALGGHPDMHKLPGVEANTGALGHGLSIATGMALGLRKQGIAARVFVVTGDGELPEGSNWEAAAAAAHHGADNLVVVVDNNDLQISGRVSDVMSMAPIAGKFAAFGWATREIDGNDMSQVLEALDATPFESGKPSLIVAHTVKAKGLAFAEDQAAYHYWKPKDDELARAVAELDARIAQLENSAKQLEGAVK
ncbi:transketolase [Brooklawnia cerclae]|uniref:Transketolase n=1 Tax=Brooklawnia cerclae TaxID=349934 RepID=A0ABX0SGM8_9ACTN|nr:transketolase [Brooklawnia cerclae]